MSDAVDTVPESPDSVKNLLAFAREIMATYPDYTLDNAALRDIAVRHDLPFSERRTEPCGAFWSCLCAQNLPDFEMADGFICDRKADCLHNPGTARIYSTLKEIQCP